jgi:polar amino acid transport system substrate-binding protein
MLTPRTVCTFIMALCLSSSAYAAEPLQVRVGGYQFAPFVEFGQDGRASGLTLDLIEAMNQFQQDYQFIFIATEPTLRYKEFSAQRFDMLLFENKAWGWQNYPVDSSQPYLTGGERYIAKALPGRDQQYFTALSDKRLVGIRGYHYRFADFVDDPDVLHNRFNINLIDSNAGSIRMVLSGRADIAVVTQSFLTRYFQHHPTLRAQLLVSDHFDQHYQHTALIRRGMALDAEAIDELLSAMQAQGQLDQLWRKYGVYTQLPAQE